MFIGTLKLNRALQAVFGLLTILFFLLAVRDFGGGAIWGKIAGWEGILTGARGRLRRRRADTSTRSTGGSSCRWARSANCRRPSCWITGKRSPPCGSRTSGAARRRRRTAWCRMRSWSTRANSHSRRWTSTSAANHRIPTSGSSFTSWERRGPRRVFRLPELISAILLLKREIWMSARTHGVWESAMDLQRAVDLNRELGRFFDRAVYYATAGYTGYPLQSRRTSSRRPSRCRTETPPDAGPHPAAFFLHVRRRRAGSLYSAVPPPRSHSAAAGFDMTPVTGCSSIMSGFVSFETR